MKALTIFLIKLAATSVAALFIAAVIVAAYDNYFSYDARLHACERTLIKKNLEPKSVGRFCLKEVQP